MAVVHKLEELPGLGDRVESLSMLRQHGEVTLGFESGAEVTVHLAAEKAPDPAPEPPPKPAGPVPVACPNCWSVDSLRRAPADTFVDTMVRRCEVCEIAFEEASLFLASKEADRILHGALGPDVRKVRLLRRALWNFFAPGTEFLPSDPDEIVNGARYVDPAKMPPREA